MPAITVEDALILPRIAPPDPHTSRARPVAKLVESHAGVEGGGIRIRRPFPGTLSMADADPFLLLDHAGPTMNGPGETKGAPWHPHRGFETVTYMLDGEVSHHDTTGGGGVIAEGETQWMTAGGGIQHAGEPHRALVSQWRLVPSGAAVGQSAARSEAGNAQIPVDQERSAAAAHYPRWRRAHPAHRRRHRRLFRNGRDPHSDHVRARHLGPRRAALDPVEPGVQRVRIRARRPRHRGAESRPIDNGELSQCSAQAITSSSPRLTNTQVHSRCCSSAGCRSGHRSEHYGPFVMNTREEIRPSRRGLPGRPTRRHPR